MTESQEEKPIGLARRAGFDSCCCGVFLIPPGLVLLSLVLFVISYAILDNYSYEYGPVNPQDMVGTWKIKKPGRQIEHNLLGWEVARIVLHEDGTCECRDFPREMRPREPETDDIIIGLEKSFTATWKVEKYGWGGGENDPMCIRLWYEGESFFSTPIAKNGPPYMLARCLGDPDEHDYQLWIMVDE